MLKDFRGFLTTSNALALAVGVIIGVAVGSVVSALVDDVIMPLVGLLLPSGSWREAKIVLTTTIDASGKVTENAILYGHFLGTLLDFVLIAFVVFLIVRAVLRPKPTRNCPECLETIPADARRCRACASTI